jgi:hypothetical protein
MPRWPSDAITSARKPLACTLLTRCRHAWISTEAATSAPIEYHRISMRTHPRLADAIDVIRAARRPDGTWLQERRHPGRVWFEVDVPPGEPSPWLTLHSARVLTWWTKRRLRGTSSIK